MTANIDSMAYHGETPWHQLGTKMDGEVSKADKMIKAAGLDWDVIKVPVGFRNPFTKQEHQIEHKYATVRTDSWKALGVVGEAYTVLQNRDAFRLVDDVMDSSDAKYETAGSLVDGNVRPGYRVWAMARLPKDIVVDKTDKIRPYFLISNSHDGSSFLTMHLTPVRVVCMNTLIAAIGAAKRSFAIKHTAGLTFKAVEARDALGIMFQYYKSLEEVFNTLSSVTMTDDEFRQVLAEILPGDTKKKETSRDEIVQLLDRPTNLKWKDTAWGKYNAAIEWQDHHRLPRKSDRMADNMFERVIMDAGDFKQDILQSIAAAKGVKL